MAFLGAALKGREVGAILGGPVGAAVGAAVGKGTQDFISSVTGLRH